MMSKKNRYVPALKDGRYVCDIHEVKEGFFWHTALSLIKSTAYRLFNNKEKVDWYAPELPIERSQELVLTWIGHATVLIQVDGLNILTDPIFGAPSILFPRITRPGIARKHIPPIDLVIISHNHHDHMHGSDLRALAARNPNIRFLVPQGNKEWFDARSIGNTFQYGWWDQYTMDDTLTCTFLPAVHWTQRTLFDRNKSLWGSWMIQCKERTIYFGGDTAFGNHFETIAHEFPSIDIALLPIGPCEPRQAMGHAHIDAFQAIQAFKILGAKHFFPIHWGTFHFGNEPSRQPLERLQQGWAQEIFTQESVLHTPKAGQKIPIHNVKKQ